MMLIVDDESTSLLMLEMVLRRENAGAMVAGIVGAGGIRMAKSGKEAMVVLESAESACRLVITDIKMPGMDGKELLAVKRTLLRRHASFDCRHPDCVKQATDGRCPSRGPDHQPAPEVPGSGRRKRAAPAAAPPPL